MVSAAGTTYSACDQYKKGSQKGFYLEFHERRALPGNKMKIFSKNTYNRHCMSAVC